MGRLIERAMRTAKQITISAADSGDIINTINSEDEIQEFINALNIDEWEITSVPEDAEQRRIEEAQRSCDFVFFLKKPVNSNGYKKDFIKMYSYKNQSYVALHIITMITRYKVSEDTASYLESLTHRHC